MADLNGGDRIFPAISARAERQPHRSIAVFRPRGRQCHRSVVRTKEGQNRAFKEAAEALGLSVAQVPHYGFAVTRLKPETVERYQEDLKYLAEVLIHRAKPLALSGATPKGGEDEPPDDKPTSRNRKAVCSCSFIIRVAKATLEQTVIRCESCGGPFVLA